MKYFITFIALATAIFVTINARVQRTSSVLAEPSSPDALKLKPWEEWNGRGIFTAEEIADYAVQLFNDNNLKTLKRYKVANITKKQKRKFDGANRYRVLFDAKYCKVLKVTIPCKKGGKSKKCKGKVVFKFKECNDKKVPFRALLKIEKPIGDGARLNVTNLENGKSLALVVKPRKHH